MILLGIDIGTSGCKVTAIDAAGRVLAEASGEIVTSRPRPGWAEQAPEDWCAVLREILAGMFRGGSLVPGHIAALALDGSTHNAVLLDRHGRALRPAIMWTDQRAAAEAAELNRLHGDDLLRIAYQTAAPTWTLPQMLWLRRHEPDVLPRTDRMMFTKDYVRWRLTDVWCTDTIEAQGTLFHDMARGRWSAELYALAGIPAAILPPLVSPTEVVGRVTAAAAREFGLPEGIPVVCGCSDSAVEDYAAGAIEPGQCVVKLATAGNVNVMTAEPHPHPRTLTYSHVIPGLWYTVTATNSAALCLRWFRDAFCAGEAHRAQARGANPYDELDRLAAASPLGARGLLFHPYLQGERSPYWDPDLRGSFTGLTMRHGRGDCLRALMEGVAFSLRDCRRVLDAMGLPIREIRLIGGGARSEIWSRIVCDVLGADVVRPSGCDASFGSALLAGVGTGVFADPVQAVTTCVRTLPPLVPEPTARTAYDHLFDIYRDLQQAVAESHHRLAAFDREGRP
ncbi:MAG: xylulokinase [Lentisphaeria bacterium]|nr:xylulokinase [Lentisphaeria bacterium]